MRGGFRLRCSCQKPAAGKDDRGDGDGRFPPSCGAYVPYALEQHTLERAAMKTTSAITAAESAGVKRSQVSLRRAALRWRRRRHPNRPEQ